MLSWGTVNGVMAAYPITRDLDLVRIPPDMTHVSFAINGGCTVTITELVTP